MKSLPHPSRAGSARSVLIRIILGAAMLWGGGQGLYTWFRNKEITSMTLGEYLKKKPEAEWIEIKGGTLDIPKSVVVKKRDKIKELYIPLTLSPGEDGPAHVVLHTEGLEYVALFNELNALPEDKIIELIAKNRQRIWPAKDIRGLLEFGISSNTKHRDKLKGLGMKLTPDFVTVKDGEKPNPTLGGIMFGGGLLLIGSLLVGRKSEPARSGPPSFPQRQ